MNYRGLYDTAGGANFSKYTFWIGSVCPTNTKPEPTEKYVANAPLVGIIQWEGTFGEWIKGVEDLQDRAPYFRSREAAIAWLKHTLEPERWEIAV